MMRLFKPIPVETKIDFVAKRYMAFTLTLLLLALAVGSFFTHSLKMGIDFKGGILIDAAYAPGGTPAAVDVHVLREKLAGLGLGEVSLQQFGGDNNVLIRVQEQVGGDDKNTAAVNDIKAALGEGWNYNRTESVGPTVGDELLRTGAWSILLAICSIAAYVAFRFEWQFGVAAMTTILHDVIVSMGLIAVLGLEFNLTSVAALMLLAGKSVNDTVIVFDRIRENLRKYKQMSLAEIINLSVNQTLSRTIFTTLTVLLAIVPMLFLGGEVLLSFTAVITWGMVVGTFSSIYVASALLLYLPPPHIGRVDAATQAAKA